MSYGIINPNSEQQRAWKQQAWGRITRQADRLKGLFPGHNPRTQRLTRVSFSDQSLAMLELMNDFDLRKVLNEIIDLTYNPSPVGHKRHWRNPWLRFIKSRYPFPGYHYLIEYEVQSNGGIAVTEILYDEQLFGPQKPYANECNMLYNVQRGNGMKYDRPLAREELDNLPDAWRLDKPVPQITTRHAAVNGMQNNLNKAVWLMGVHLDAAYRTANPKEYTLFHNPTEGGGIDFVECIWDKQTLNISHNARHLAAVLQQRQMSGEKTEWVVHSQGAIIFNAAVSHHNTHVGTPLSRHKVAVHGSGAKMTRLRANLRKAQIELVHTHNNPFDLVPNLAGSNNWSASGLYRSLKFMGLVFNDNGGNSGISPHTLPYLGVRTYQKQLELGGYTEEAKQVQRYIAKRDRLRQQRRKA
jgi:hypothetical protein